jgi:antitoxin component YwqK of YwqJK toxin-antitoxin module
MKVEIIEEYHPNGSLRYQWSYLNGESHSITYFINGKKESDYRAKNGIFYGIDQIWHKNGTRQDINCWKNSRRNGPKIIFKYGN